MTWFVIATYIGTFVAGAIFGPKAIAYGKQAIDWVRAKI